MYSWRNVKALFKTFFRGKKKEKLRKTNIANVAAFSTATLTLWKLGNVLNFNIFMSSSLSSLNVGVKIFKQIQINLFFAYFKLHIFWKGLQISLNF